MAIGGVPRVMVAGGGGAALAREVAPLSPEPIQPSNDTSPLGGSREERIGEFLGKLAAGGVEQLRYLSAVAVGELCGMAVGGMIFPWLGPALGSLYVITGGMAASGAIGALAGYALESRNSSKGNRSGTIGSMARTALSALRAVPDILYPSILGATSQERGMILDALAKLPLKDVATVEKITVVDGLERLGASGLTFTQLTQTPILLDRAQIGHAGFGPRVVTHEMGHGVDLSSGLGVVGNHSWWWPWGRPPYVVDNTLGNPMYAATNRFEDFAQSYLFFHDQPADLAAANAAKADALARLNQPGLLEHALDRPDLREISKRVAEWLGSVPGLRDLLSFLATIAAPLQLKRGAARLEEAGKSGDMTAVVRGKMELASGFLLAYKPAAPLALLNLAFAWGLRKGMAKGWVAPETAGRVANGILATSAGPVGLAALGALQELPPVPPEAAAKQIPRGSLLFGIASFLTGGYLGAIAGALVGTAMAGVPGGMAGAALGKLGGAVAGLALSGARHVPKLMKREGLPPEWGLTSDDMRYLGKVTGGALLGGGLAGAAGYLGGGVLGGIAGAFLGAPGVVTGTFLGKLGGLLLGSYAGARLGAKAGKAFDP